MSIVLKTPSNGSVTLAEQDTASNVTVTIPSRTASVMLDGPAFSAYANVSQTLSPSTFTKIQINTELFDTNSCFDTATYRFTPNLAGYYKINAQTSINGTTNNSRIIPAIYKNGVLQNLGTDTDVVATLRGVISTLLYLNGTTDYVEFYALASGSGTLSTQVTLVQSDNYFQGFMVRGA